MTFILSAMNTILLVFYWYRLTGYVMVDEKEKHSLYLDKIALRKTRLRGVVEK